MVSSKGGIPVPFLLFFIDDCFELLQGLFWVILLLRYHGIEDTATTKEKQRTLRGIIHVLDICTLPLIAIAIIRVIEGVILISTRSINCRWRSPLDVDLVVTALHVIGIFVVHDDRVLVGV